MDAVMKKVHLRSHHNPLKLIDEGQAQVGMVEVLTGDIYHNDDKERRGIVGQQQNG